MASRSVLFVSCKVLAKISLRNVHELHKPLCQRLRMIVFAWALNVPRCLPKLLSVTLPYWSFQAGNFILSLQLNKPIERMPVGAAQW